MTDFEGLKLETPEEAERRIAGETNPEVMVDLEESARVAEAAQAEQTQLIADAAVQAGKDEQAAAAIAAQLRDSGTVDNLQYGVSQYLGTTKYGENGQIAEVFGAARLDGPAMLEAYAKNPLNRYMIAAQLIRDPNFVKLLYEVYRQNPKTSRTLEEFSDSLQRELELGNFDSVVVGDNRDRGEKIKPTTENLNKARQE